MTRPCTCCLARERMGPRVTQQRNRQSLIKHAFIYGTDSNIILQLSVQHEKLGSVTAAVILTPRSTQRLYIIRFPDCWSHSLTIARPSFRIKHSPRSILLSLLQLRAAAEEARCVGLW
jgi:hypothetical protein